MSPRVKRPNPANRVSQLGARQQAPRARTPRASRMQTPYITQAGQDVARPFALIVGVVYLAAGLIGFAVTGFDQNIVSPHGHALIGFALNPFHNLIHVAVGVILIVVSQVRDSTITQGVLIGGGLVYLAAALLGFLDRLQIIAIHGGGAPDNFLHLFSGLAALLVGVLTSMQQSRSQPLMA